MDKSLLPNDPEKLEELILQQNRLLADLESQLAAQNIDIADKNTVIEEFPEQVELL
ncbi:hypothetical protein [Maridesulfovibrio bastinii]|uniref:hypothetical protein n=1 Tax=Maridesulfovibrio bastinii TaxID=47157 RepID=UPI00041C2A43|nr:hypothetical protein [Maridesulfovibrio bastinii]